MSVMFFISGLFSQPVSLMHFSGRLLLCELTDAGVNNTTCDEGVEAHLCAITSGRTLPYFTCDGNHGVCAEMCNVSAGDLLLADRRFGEQTVPDWTKNKVKGFANALLATAKRRNACLSSLRSRRVLSSSSATIRLG